MSKHKLLIIITTYERGYNLPSIVENIVNQTFKDYKIVIADDCSPEDPTEIIKKIKKKYPKVDIEHHRNRENVGEGINIALALGREWDNGFKYLVILQDDTIYLDNTFLENGTQSLEQNPDVMYCAGLIARNGQPSKLLQLPPDQNSLVKINGLHFWRMWGGIGIHWTSCVFRYEDFFQYRFSNLVRKDVFNGDSLTLLRLAMKSSVIVFNKIIIDISYNKAGTSDFSERLYKDPVDKFVKMEKYYKLASESAVEHGASKEEADNWLANHQVRLATIAINSIGKNDKLMRKLTNTLMEYDKSLSVSLLYTVLKSLMR